MDRDRIQILLVGILFLAARPAPGQEPEDRPTPVVGPRHEMAVQVELPKGKKQVTVPLLRSGVQLYVRVTVNGFTGLFELDTGWNPTVIDRQWASDLRFPVVRRGRSVFKGTENQQARLLRVDSMSIGQVRVMTRRLLDYDLGPKSRHICKALRGVLGMDILRHVPLTLDYRAETITFHAPGSFTPPANTPSYELKFSHGLPVLLGKVNGELAARLAVDTGANSSLILADEFIHRHRQALAGPVVSVGYSTGATGNERRIEVRSVKLQVLGRTFDQVLANFGWSGDFDGLLGARFLRRFRLTLDVPGRRIWVEDQPRRSFPRRLKEGLDPNATDLLGRSPLKEAINDRDVEGVVALIEAGANVNDEDNCGLRLLNEAAALGDSEIVKRLLAAEATVDVRPPRSGITALFVAAKQGHAGVVRELLKSGANPRTESTDGLEPIHVAAYSGSLEVVKMLLEAGAPLDARGGSGETLIAFAALGGHTEMIEFLLERGADVNRAGGTRHLTPLHAAALSDRPECVSLLLEAGAKIDPLDSTRGTPLMRAIAKRRDKASRILIEAGANVNHTAMMNLTPLRVAAEFGTPKTIELLVRKGANVKFVDDQGRSPLAAAVVFGQSPEVIALLIGAGADVRPKTRDGISVIFYAALKSDPSVVAQLLEVGADPNSVGPGGRTPLHAAILRDSADVVKLLLEWNANLEATTSAGVTPLGAAAASGQTEVTRMLLERGADIRSRTPEGATPLMAAAQGGNAETLELLLEKGTDVHAVDKAGATALGYAASAGQLDSVRILMAADAKLEVKNTNGQTPLMIAVYMRRDLAVAALIAADANVNVKDVDGVSCLQRARTNRDQLIVDLLERAGARD